MDDPLTAYIFAGTSLIFIVASIVSLILSLKAGISSKRRKYLTLCAILSGTLFVPFLNLTFDLIYGQIPLFFLVLSTVILLAFLLYILKSQPQNSDNNRK